MSHPKFDEKELKVVSEMPGFFPGMAATPLYDFPVTRKEAYISMMKKDPIWQITTIESGIFTPQIIADNIARGFSFEAQVLARENFGGKDMFGVEWVYVDVAGGSMVKPGSPLLENANEWYDKLVWPDVDSWDWETSGKLNREFFDRSVYLAPTILNGFYERLISFMDFDGAILAMIDEDQKEAVKDLFDKLADLYIKIIDKFIEYYQIDGISFHDDWGSQRAPFFSPATGLEMVVPAMKKLTDHIHAKGLFADLHSCGHLELQVPNFIAAGWDSWSPMPMNNIEMLYEKYGDKIVLGAIPEPFDPTTASEEEQRAAAARFVDQYCQKDKPTTISFYGSQALTPAFREELYKLSRIKFSEQAQLA